MITSHQIRAARALIGWSQRELAERAEVGVATVRRIEGMPAYVAGNIHTIMSIKTALEIGGVVFIEQTDSRGPGVQLRDPLD